MAGRLDGTIGETALAMGPGETLVIQRVSNGVVLTMTCEPYPGTHKAVQESIAVDLIPPEPRSVKDVADAVLGIFKTARDKANRGIMRGNRGQIGDEPSTN